MERRRPARLARIKRIVMRRSVVRKRRPLRLGRQPRQQRTWRRRRKMEDRG